MVDLSTKVWRIVKYPLLVALVLGASYIACPRGYEPKEPETVPETLIYSPASRPSSHQATHQGIGNKFYGDDRDVFGK